MANPAFSLENALNKSIEKLFIANDPLDFPPLRRRVPPIAPLQLQPLRNPPMSQASPFSKLIHFQVVINGVPKSVAMKIERKSSNPNNWPSLVNPPRLKFDCLLEGNTSNKLWAFQRPWKRTSFQRHRVHLLPAGDRVGKRSKS